MQLNQNQNRGLVTDLLIASLHRSDRQFPQPLLPLHHRAARHHKSILLRATQLLLWKLFSNQHGGSLFFFFPWVIWPCTHCQNRPLKSTHETVVTWLSRWEEALGCCGGRGLAGAWQLLCPPGFCVRVSFLSCSAQTDSLPQESWACGGWHWLGLPVPVQGGVRQVGQRREAGAILLIA